MFNSPYLRTMVDEKPASGADLAAAAWRKLRTSLGALVLGERSQLGRRLIYLLGVTLSLCVTLEGLFLGVAPYAQPALNWTFGAAVFGLVGTFWRNPRVLRVCVMGLGTCLVLSMCPLMGTSPSTSILAGISLVSFWTSLYLSIFWNLSIWLVAAGGIYRSGATLTVNTLHLQDPTAYPIVAVVAYIVIPLCIGALLRRDEDARHAALQANIDALSAERAKLRVAFEHKAQELEGSRQALLEAERHHTTGRIASGLAHELNNILTPIHGLAELLVQNPHSAQTERYAQSILHSAQSASMMTQALLTYTRQGQFDPMVLESSQFFAQLILPELKSLIPPQIQLHTDVEPGILLNIDRRLMLQTVWHLLRNAIEAMPDGGVLMLSLRVEDDPAPAQTTARAGDPERWARLTVSDTGKGIAKENLGRVFDPFFTTKTFGVGAGLGLALVHGAITQHGGKISMESELSRGTSLHLDLPVVSGQPEDLDEDPTSLYFPVQAKILIASPERDTRDELEEHLVERGFAVDCIASLPELLDELAPRSSQDSPMRWSGRTWILDAALAPDGPPDQLAKIIQRPEGPQVLIAVDPEHWPVWRHHEHEERVRTVPKPLHLQTVDAFMQQPAMTQA